MDEQDMKRVTEQTIALHMIALEMRDHVEQAPVGGDVPDRTLSRRSEDLLRRVAETIETSRSLVAELKRRYARPGSGSA